MRVDTLTRIIVTEIPFFHFVAWLTFSDYRHCAKQPRGRIHSPVQQGRRQEFEEGRAELLGCEAPETTWRRAPKFFGSRKPHPLINDSLRMCKK